MMRNLLFAIPILLCLAATSASPLFKQSPAPAIALSVHQQEPMVGTGPGLFIPGSDSNKSSKENDGGSSPSSLIIADVLPRERSISIFASLARDTDAVADRLQDSGTNATVLAPINAALAALPRKPWEDPEDYQKLGNTAYYGADGGNRAQKNLQRFIEAHIVPSSPLAVGEKVKALAGNTVWVEEKDGKKFIQPGNVEVQGVADKVSNGEVWILKGVINPAS